MLDTGTKLPENRIHLFDPVGLINDGYGGYKASNYAIRPKMPTMSHETNNSAGTRSNDTSNTDTNGGGTRFYDHSSKETNGVDLRLRVKTKEEDELETRTPHLWQPGCPTSPRAVGSPLHPTSPRSVGSPMHSNYHHYHTMSPSSRTQAIAKGRQELMEMVRGLPEPCYELSLKDLVEQKPDKEPQMEINPPEEKKPVKEMTKPKEIKKPKNSSKNVNKSESMKKMVSSKSVDNGKFLLKTTMFPIFLGSKKSKKNMGGSNSFKIAPMTKPQPTTTGSIKGVEKDWRKRSCISSESDDSNGSRHSSVSSRSSSSESSRSSRSNSSRVRRNNRFLPTCCFFNGRRITRGK